MFFKMSKTVGNLCTQCRRIGCSKDLSFTLYSVEKTFSVFVALFHQGLLYVCIILEVFIRPAKRKLNTITFPEEKVDLTIFYVYKFVYIMLLFNLLLDVNLPRKRRILVL